MSYKVVEFENEEVAVVLETWLTPNKENTFWPSSAGDQLSYVRTLRKKQEVDYSWQTYPIARIFYETDDVDKALKKLSTAENTSNLETDLEESAVSVVKRKRYKKRVFCDSDSEEDESNSASKHEKIKRPPPIKFGNKSFSQLNLTTARGPKIPQQNTSKTDYSNDNHLIAEDVRQSLTKYVDRSSLYLGPNSSIPGHLRNSSTLSSVNCGCHEVVTQLLNKIVKIEQQNGQILTTLRQQITGKSISAPKLNINFPAKSIDDLHLLEEELTEENTAYLESYLSSLGGEGVVARTNRILKELLCDTLAIQYNFCGGNNKHAFNKLKLKTVIVDSVKNALKETTTENVENAIKVWLKHASHRVKRRVAAQAK